MRHHRPRRQDGRDSLPVDSCRRDGGGWSSRRTPYRHSKRVLTRLLGRRWKGPRWALEPAVRRFLRARPRSYLARLLGDRGFALAAGFGKTGLDKWIGEQLTGVATLPLFGVILIICLAITFLTELTSNTATTTMILPIIGATAVAASFHPLLLMIPATLSASFAFMLPVATPPNAIVYSSGWVTIPRMSRAGVVLNFFGAILVTTMVLVFVEMIFL